MMVQRDAHTARELVEADENALRRLLDASDYVYARFDRSELGMLLRDYPAVGVEHTSGARLMRTLHGALRAFLLVSWLVPPSAWLGGFGVSESEGAHFADYLDLLLPPLAVLASARGARTLYYSGSDFDSDWLREPMAARGFHLTSLLRSYDKNDFAIPSPGSSAPRVRPFAAADLPDVLAIEQASFEQLWRHDAASFLAVAASYPYFVVAEDDQGIVGYQFNTVDASIGYLVRIAVHPRAVGQGVGTRLLAEAVRYFQRQQVWKIVLNAEEGNTRAHALYERFGFQRIAQQGFVLACDIASA